MLSRIEDQLIAKFNKLCEEIKLSFDPEKDLQEGIRDQHIIKMLEFWSNEKPITKTDKHFVLECKKIVCLQKIELIIRKLADDNRLDIVPQHILYDIFNQ